MKPPPEGWHFCSTVCHHHVSAGIYYDSDCKITQNLWPLPPVPQVCKDKRVALDGGRGAAAGTTRHFSHHSESLSIPLPSRYQVPRQTPPTSLKCAPKLTFQKRPGNFTQSEMEVLSVRKAGGVKELISEISLLTCSHSIPLKLFITAQCSDTKCFPSESQGFK